MHSEKVFHYGILGNRYLIILWACAITACAPAISQFNETAYRQAVQLKVQSLALIDKATEPYEEYSEEADRLRQELNIA